MNTFARALLAGAIAGFSAVAPASAADEPASPHTFTGNVTLANQYIFRGLTQTNEDPAIQGGLDYSHASGVYLGAWGSNISWLTDANAYTSSSLELDVYGGFRKSVGDVSYDVGVLQYIYPGDVAPGVVKADTTELYALVGWKWLTAKYSHVVSDKVFGLADAQGSYYLDLSANLPVGETGVTLGAHWGKQKFKGTTAGAANDLASYEDWKLSVAYDLGKQSKLFNGVTVGVAYTDTNASKAVYGAPIYPKYIGDKQGLLWVTKAF